MKTVGSQLKKLDEGIIFLTEKLNKIDISDEISSSEFDLVSRKLRALNEILEYVNTYKWVKHLAVIDKIKFIRHCDYDYQLIKRELHLSDDALKSFMYRINQNLNQKIGEKTISLILSNEKNWSDGLMQFRILSGTYSLKEVLLSECYSDLPEKKFTTYSLKECLKEIEYIYTYSDICRKLSKRDLDENKLAFIRYILESETEKYRQEQKDLMLVLQGINITYEDFLISLNDKFELDVGL